MDIIDGFLDSHYSYTATPASNTFLNRQINATTREIKLNHLNVLFFTFKIFHRNVLSFGWTKLSQQTDQIDEKYILIS
jgi:hypothetical protein